MNSKASIIVKDVQKFWDFIFSGRPDVMKSFLTKEKTLDYNEKVKKYCQQADL